MFKRVYTVGCFDYFHRGHQNLLANMRRYGNEVVVGIHDDWSIEKLKNLKPDEHQPLEVRMKNVKKFADSVFVIPHTDPTLCLQCMIQDKDNFDNACFIRGNDMPNFPGRQFIDNKISIVFLPYTKGVSSTKIRQNKKK